MKVLVVLLGLITAMFLSGLPATSGLTMKISAYIGTGELDLDVHAQRDAFTLGTRVLLICNVTGIPEGGKQISYKWEHNCTGGTHGRCEVQDGDPYYRVVNDTLLVDITSWDLGGKYYCTVHYMNEGYKYNPNSWTPTITVAGSPVPFLYTPTSLLPEHSVLTDVEQATGRNGQQWITCRSGEESTRTEIWMGGAEVATNSSTANSATIGLGTQHPNGLYHCLSAQSQRQYFSLFLRSSVHLTTPNVSVQNTTTMWTLTSPDGSRVERYIVEFECSVRNITFVEKYMSVSASGGTGQVATCVSCFGGLGQLYRVKVWAVSGPSISHALVYIPDPYGQCREEGGRHKMTCAVSDCCCGNGGSGTPTTTSPPGNTGKSAPTPSGPHLSITSNATMQPDGTSIAVGVGVGVFLLFVILIMVVIILVAVFVKRRAVYKQKRDATMRDNLHCSNTVVAEQEMELKGATRQKMDQRDYGFTATNNDLYAMPMSKMGRMTDKGLVVVVSGGVEEEEYDDIIGLTYKPKAISNPWQQMERGSKY